MKITKNWLKEFVNVDDKLKELIEEHVIEIEGSEKLVDATNLIIGKINELEKHPLNIITLSYFFFIFIAVEFRLALE